MVVDINLTPTGSQFELPTQLVTPDGTTLEQIIAGRTWGTASECKSAALLIHGLGAHSGWFEALGRRLKVRRVYALAYDHVGFGKRRGQTFLSRKQWVDDLVTMFSYLRKTIGDKPIYVMGNSMGAVLALKAASILKCQGLVMFSPGFGGNSETFKIGYRMKALSTAFLKPDQEVALPYGVDQVTREQSVRQWLAQDPDRRFLLPARMLFELLQLTREAKAGVKRVPCPVLMLTAGVEKIVDNSISNNIFESIVAPSKTKFVFNDAWHDLMFDPVIDEMADYLSDWITETAPSKVNA